MKRLSVSGHLWHAGHHYHVGEAFGHCRVGLKRKHSGQTEIYFANRLLGHLVFDPAARMGANRMFGGKQTGSPLQGNPRPHGRRFRTRA